MNKFLKNSILPKKIIISLPAILISISFLLSIAPRSVLADNLSWTTKADLPTARYGLGATAGNNGRIYAIGGSNIDGRYRGTNEEYNPFNNTWTAKANMPTGREYPGVVKASDGKIYAVGGFNGSSGYLNTVEAYDPSSDTWTTLNSMPTPRYTLGVAATNDGKIYAIGGLLHGYKLNTVEVYDIATNTWTSATSMPTPRAGLVAVTNSNGKIYAIGGADLGDSPIAINEEYDPLTNLWTTKAPMPTTKTYFAAVNASNGRIYAIGGRPTTDSTLTTSTVVSYDPNIDIWLSEASMPTPRQHFAAATIGSKIYALGGYNQINNILSILLTVEEATIVPDNLPPTVQAGGLYQVNEGGYVQVSATGNDPENGPIMYAWDLDNNGSFETSGQAVNFSATVLDGPTSKTITVQVTDNGNLTVTDQATVNVLNVAPIATFTNTSGIITEGGSATLAFSNQFDPSIADVSADFHNTYSCDGSPFTGVTYANSAQTSSKSCSFADNGTYTVLARIIDKDDGYSDYQTSVIVNNVNPTIGDITVSPSGPVVVNTTINTNASFTDLGTPDTHTAVWDWGDATTSAGTVIETNGSGSVTGSHVYTTPGVYIVKLTVADDDGGSGESVFQFVVVYDPEGGFVTGGGWIDSPSGAYTADPSLTGRANFGFISKYQHGANVPTGQTEFQFKVASFNFHSTSYDWLVVAGPNAKYKGSGTINGSGDYGFMLTAVDGQINGGDGIDRFRIKIWDKSTDMVIYDNQMGENDDANATDAIEAGSIVIH